MAARDNGDGGPGIDDGRNDNDGNDQSFEGLSEANSIEHNTDTGFREQEGESGEWFSQPG